MALESKELVVKQGNTHSSTNGTSGYNDTYVFSHYVLYINYVTWNEDGSYSHFTGEKH